METEDNYPEENHSQEVEIYSKSAIWWFSIIFSTLFGAILLIINMRNAGYKKEIYQVIAFLIAWYFVCVIIIGNVAADPRFLSIGLNVAGGAILAEYFFKKYFPDKDYYPKSIVMPLLISLLVVLPFLAVTIYKMHATK